MRTSVPSEPGLRKRTWNVAREGTRWAVSAVDSFRVARMCRTQAEAVERACEIARKFAPGQIMVHDGEGNVVDLITIEAA